MSIVRWFLLKQWRMTMVGAGSYASSSKLAKLKEGFLATEIGRAMLEALRALMLEI